MGRQAKGRGNDGGGLNVILLIYVKSEPYKSTWKDVGCHLHVSSVKRVSSKEVEGKPWPHEERRKKNKRIVRKP